jgi:hypothetical protein
LHVLEMRRVVTELADRHLNSVEYSSTQTDRNVFTRHESFTYIPNCKQQHEVSKFSHWPKKLEEL